MAADPSATAFSDEPQAIRRVLPATAGQFANLVKDSSLLYVIGLGEFTMQAREANAQTYATFESYLPLALGYLVFVSGRGTGHFAQGVALDTWLLVGCGAVTAVPLMLYANGAKGLKLSTIAIMQYIAPTMIFLTAVFIFHEPFGRAQMIAFPLIWAALVLYSGAMLVQARGARAASRVSARGN